MSLNPAELLEAARQDDRTRPLLTFYDDGSGERVELSVETFANWVAKTANLLVEGAALHPGGRAIVRLPLHWQTAVVLVACWSAGLQVETEGTHPDVAIVTEDDPLRGAETVMLSLRPLGRGLTRTPPNVVDFAAEVPAYGDSFVPMAPAVVADLGPALERGARVLSVLPYDSLSGRWFGLLGPLAFDGSAVICRNPDHEALSARVHSERVTATAGVDVSEVPRLA